jgi:hypothetical protein
MKLKKPILLQYLVTYIVVNLNYFNWIDMIDNSKSVLKFREKIEKINSDKWDLEVELVKCNELDEKKTFHEMKKVIKKKLYNNPKCIKISDKLTKLIIKKNKLYYSKSILNYVEKLLKIMKEINSNLKNLLKNNIYKKKTENINNLIHLYIKNRMKDLKDKKMKKEFKKSFKGQIKEFLKKNINEKDIKQSITRLINSNKEIINIKEKFVKELKKNMTGLDKLNTKKIFNDYNKYSLGFV